jgi:hypothetical protein
MKPFLFFLLFYFPVAGLAQSFPLIKRERAALSFNRPYLYNEQPVNMFQAARIMRQSKNEKAVLYSRRFQGQRIIFTGIGVAGIATILALRKQEKTSTLLLIGGATISAQLYVAFRAKRNFKRALKAYNSQF